jgi:hypothetical protein
MSIERLTWIERICHQCLDACFEAKLHRRAFCVFWRDAA